MSVKKMFALVAAVLMVVGLADMSQAAITGVRVRVAYPPTGTWAEIGDSVVVNVDAIQSVTLDSVIVAISDSAGTRSAAFGEVQGVASTQVRQAGTTSTTIADGSYTKRYRFKYSVTAGFPESDEPNMRVLVKLARAAERDTISNQSTALVANQTTLGTIGDQVRFGIDGLRPIATSVTVDVDTSGTKAGFFPGSTTARAFGVGKEVKVAIVPQNPPTGATGVLYLVNADSVAESDAVIRRNSKKTVNFTELQLLLATARDSFTLSAGDIGDKIRLRAVAFLTDPAGNLSHTATASAPSPAGFSDDLTHVYDTTVPKVTAVYPKTGTTADSMYFTGDITDSYTQVNVTNSADQAQTPALKPLRFKVNEKALKLVAKAGSDSITTTTTLAKDVEEKWDTYTAGTDSLGKAGADQDGLKLTLNIFAEDSVGNRGTLELKDVIYDVVDPALKDWFPKKTSVPKDPANSDAPTVNAVTAQPKLELKEKLDSLAVRYVQANVSTPDSRVVELSYDATSSPNKELQNTATQWTLSPIESATDTLLSGKKYTLQFIMRDLAGNFGVTTPDTLTFHRDFQNPIADSFVVAADADSVIAGTNMTITITAIDTSLTNASGANRAAVTHKRAAALRVVVADGEDLGAAGTVTIAKVSGYGALTDNKDGTALLDSDWPLGVKKVTIKSTKVLTNFMVVVEDTSVSADGVASVNYSGVDTKLSVDAAIMDKYMVTAMKDGAVVTAVSKGFSIKVVPTDQYGNMSTKKESTLDTRIAKSNVLGEIFVDISANTAGTQVPPGPQAVAAGGSMFGVIAPNPDETMTGLVVSVKTSNVMGDTSQVTGTPRDILVAGGQTAELTYSPWGEGPPVTTELVAPASLIVEDWMGAAGMGDQGMFVMVSFPMAAGAGQYRVYRQMDVTTGLDPVTGELVMLDPAVPEWVSWTVLDAVPGADVIRAVVPALDNVPTLWAVASEKAGSGSGMAETLVATKRVFTKESVLQMMLLLGVDPNRVVSAEELGEMFAPSTDYVKSILGDQKLVLAALDPDLTRLLGGSDVPTTIRTAGGPIASSAMTMTAEPVAAVDNIAPAAVEAGGTFEVDKVTLSWTPSVDDKIVGYASYRGFAVPIPGVDRYEVLRGAKNSDGTLTWEDVAVATLPAGSDSWVDTKLPAGVPTLIYRVDALDLDNTAAGAVALVPVGGDVLKLFFTVDGEPVWIVNLTDATPLTEDFTDFLAFAMAWKKSKGEVGFNIQADIDEDGIVDFPDFIQFASAFGRVAVAPAATKPVVVPARPGVNDNAELSLNLGSDRVLVGETVTVDVSLANVKALQGYGLVLTYDATKFEYVGAAAAEEDLLTSAGGETPLFLEQAEAGRVTIANAIVNGGTPSGGGMVATLTFKVLNEFEDKTRFEIAEGVVFDPNQLTNQVVTLGALTVESTPTDFALLQNYPNPFNPETTIKYNLAEGANVQLRIYNIVGQVVRTLVAERQSAGRYQMRWNGTDDRGMTVSSGIYFYHISAGKFQDQRRLMLLK